MLLSPFLEGETEAPGGSLVGQRTHWEEAWSPALPAPETKPAPYSVQYNIGHMENAPCH